jgi:hypothetical protein
MVDRKVGIDDWRNKKAHMSTALVRFLSTYAPVYLLIIASAVIELPDGWLKISRTKILFYFGRIISPAARQDQSPPGWMWLIFGPRHSEIRRGKYPD